MLGHNLTRKRLVLRACLVNILSLFAFRGPNRREHYIIIYQWSYSVRTHIDIIFSYIYHSDHADAVQ